MTYDHITDQFSKDLSPLAKRMYAVIFENTSTEGVSIYVSMRELIDYTGIDVASLDSPGQNALIELLKSKLIGFDESNVFRYYVMPAAWRAHLHAAQEAAHDPR